MYHVTLYSPSLPSQPPIAVMGNPLEFSMIWTPCCSTGVTVHHHCPITLVPSSHSISIWGNWGLAKCSRAYSEQVVQSVRQPLWVTTPEGRLISMPQPYRFRKSTRRSSTPTRWFAIPCLVLLSHTVHMWTTSNKWGAPVCPRDRGACGMARVQSLSLVMSAPTAVWLTCDPTSSPQA